MLSLQLIQAVSGWSRQEVAPVSGEHTWAGYVRGGRVGGLSNLCPGQLDNINTIATHHRHQSSQDTHTVNMVLRIEEMDFDSNKISKEDVERLRQILPKDLQEPGKLTQLEIILEAIHYIKMLQNKLGTIPEY